MSKKPIPRRDFLKTTTGLCAAALGAPFLNALAQAPSKPNILFILADDLGWSDLGCYGNTYHETPNIDKLASQGMRFTDAYAACPVCSPTRASLMSGQYPAHVGVTDFITGHWRPYEKVLATTNRTQYLPNEVVTFAEALKPAGYVSGSFGKWHLGGREHFPDKQGFDEYVVTGGWAHFGNSSQPDIHITKDQHLTEVLADKGIEFMRAHRDQPFCLYLSHFAVHIPLEARQEAILKYANKPEQSEEVCNPVYAAMLEHLDTSVGRVLDELDALGIADNTIVFFYSDNGGLHQMYTGQGPIVTSNAPLRGEKGMLYEGGIREPLIVRWPGHIAPGTECHELVSTPDFYPTFLDAAGVDSPAGEALDGENIMPLLTQSGGLKRDAIYWHYPHYHHSSPAGAIREGDWKLIEFYEDGHLELYNLRQDIGEKVNVAPQFPERAEALRTKLAAWRESVDAEMPVPNPDYDPARAKEWGKHPAAGRDAIWQLIGVALQSLA